jgi:hypothetical protein
LYMFRVYLMHDLGALRRARPTAIAHSCATCFQRKCLILYIYISLRVMHLPFTFDGSRVILEGLID